MESCLICIPIASSYSYYILLKFLVEKHVLYNFCICKDGFKLLEFYEVIFDVRFELFHWLAICFSFYKPTAFNQISLDFSVSYDITNEN